VRGATLSRYNEANSRIVKIACRTAVRSSLRFVEGEQGPAGAMAELSQKGNN
jgi:hypothetical protein